VTNWKVKAVVQGTIAHLPARERVNYLFQRHITHSSECSKEWFQDKVEQTQRHLAHHRLLHGVSPIRRVLELGTGWHPAVPVGLALAGAREIFTVDRVSMLRSENVRATLIAWRDLLDEGASTLDHVDAGRESTLRRLCEDINPQLGDLGIIPIVGDAAHLGLAAQSVDLFVSNNTFEHLSRVTLKEILAQYRTLAAPGATMSHFIDMSDHFSHFDPNLSPLHFLRYDERRWKRWDNDIVPQNRMRISSYLALLRAADFSEVEVSTRVIDRAALAGLSFSSPFRELSEDELRITHAWVVFSPSEPSAPGASSSQLSTATASATAGG
jgi:hypothetical protein